MTNDHDHSPISRDHHAHEPSHTDELGEGVGGISGVLAGAAIGSAGGPIGTLIGGIAGAVGGWWAGRSISEAAAHYTDEDDKYYRGHYESDTTRPVDLDYDRARTGYAAGHLAGHNPDYRGREWGDVSTDIRRGWKDDEHGAWDRMESRVRHGWERAKDKAGDLAEAAGDKIERATDHVGGGVERAGDRIENRTDRLG